MRFVDEFREPELIRRAVEEVRALTPRGRRFRIMEICGGHTHAILRFGLPDLLPEEIDLIHGPGCPVCVLPRGRIDDGLALTRDPRIILAAFGDMMRVPGEGGSPLESKARGADVRMVYSPLDALRLAQENPKREVVFFAIGFETTAPSTALTVLRARAMGLRNFSVYCNHIRVAPAIRALLEAPGERLDGFIGPGHVSSVIGYAPYEFIARDFRRPVVVSGFEPLDLLHALVMLLRQLTAGEARVENQYQRVVTRDGSRPALRVLDEVFVVRPHFEWRGLGSIPESAFALRPELAEWDAERRFAMPGVRAADPQEAQCGEVLQGRIKPHECRLFGRECTPERPVGALMVSSEGACAAQYTFARHRSLPTDCSPAAVPRNIS